MQKKAKLRVYRQLKSDLRQEEFLAWALPQEQRVLYARLRSGTHQLRIETGRWRKEPEEERVCKVCITGSVESEAHFLLDCYVYNRLRQSMFKQIKATTGYDVASMMGDREWANGRIARSWVTSERNEKVDWTVSGVVSRDCISS